MAIKNPTKDPLKGIAKVIQTVGSGKTVGIDTDAMSVKQIRKLLVKKGVLPRKMNMGGVVPGRGGSFKGTR